ncbi:MAG: hypothetical protein J0G32_02640 [Alphaproteobacteria bacterium]|nr:hypothetical protein [Alphaproteobacteria bacterium]OJV12511.1 MAG: hypothetical protein BGO27_07250 [Alphaproteobacteria bacterium 33-17]
MITGQVMTSGITDRKILEAFFNNPRSYFLPKRFGNATYLDNHLEIGKNIFAMAPDIFATCLKYLSIKPAENVIEIGASTLHHGNIIAELCHNVDIIPVKNAFLQSEIPLAHNLTVINGKTNKKYDIAILNGAVKNYKSFLKYLEKNGKMFVFHINKEITNNTYLTDLKVIYKDDATFTEVKYGTAIMYHFGECDE